LLAGFGTVGVAFTFGNALPEGFDDGECAIAVGGATGLDEPAADLKEDG